MKRLRTWLLAVMFAHAIVAAQADLQLRPAENPACVFAGKARIIHVTFSNSSDQNFDADIRARIFQTTSATAAQTDDVSWKTLHVLPQQTIFESTALDFPEVRAE
ncbi:MAG TPA: hypothetical protein VFF11_16735, partial [Candidatus Binatia bacterium]|nr:hypothetical protein [Candidatus Binatia bacterium]